jgi:hypothetical protein
MLLAAHAYSLRQRARQSFKQGNYQAALDSIQAAERLHSTLNGRVLAFACAASNITLRQA